MPVIIGYTAHQYRKFYEKVHTMSCVCARKVWLNIVLIVMILLPIFKRQKLLKKLQIPIFSPSNYLIRRGSCQLESDNFAVSLGTARLHAVHNAKSTAQASVIYVV